MHDRDGGGGRAVMEGDAERALIADLREGLKGTFLDGQLILGGSSGLFGFATQAPAFTEDLDFLVIEELVAARGGEIVRLLSDRGYLRQPETPTFLAEGRPGFDLVGYSKTDLTDHLSREGPLRVMVFGDLSVILLDLGSVDHGPAGMAALSPAGFCAAKLMTLRVEKGAKDKLQALLVVGERASDPAFRKGLVRILSRFDPDRQGDALADAQAAFLCLQRDPEFRDHGAEGYGAFLKRAEAGFAALREMLREGRP
ncbi:MAG: hypothetical protein JXP34_19440 [Planctomycetes bacterium]|nr:hypothetical protein [Planctomycetota bacterium]